MVPVLAAATVAAFAGVAFSTSILVGWMALALIIFCAIAGVISIASLGFWFWGRYLGFSWHFTK